MADIENMFLDGDTEIQAEFIISENESLGLLDNDPDEADLQDALPGGNPIRFMKAIEFMGMRAAVNTTGIRRARLLKAVRDVESHRKLQQDQHMYGNGYALYPASIKGALSDHLKKASNE